ncbi:MAG: hypothetical protein ACRD2P_16730 [Terriglobia bacterium]
MRLSRVFPKHIRALFFIVFLLDLPQVFGARNNPAASQGQPPQYYNTAPGVRYVGSKVCASCHAGIYREYRKTAMGRSMALPDDPSELEIPAAPVTVYEGKFHRYYQIWRKGPVLLQSEYEIAPDGHDIFRDTQDIAYLVGAGENGVSYFVRKGNYLFEAPLSYYAQLRSWALSPGYDLGDYGFHRPVLAGCAVCHSGRAHPAPNRPGLYGDPTFSELSIGCENCHGPGQLHVEERMTCAPLKGAVDRSIVNPANLSGWLADNVCMMCHQLGDARILQPGKTYLDFRPGLPLDRTVAIFSVPFTPASPPQTPLLQHEALMRLSKCYRESGGKLKCITCHDPHYEPSKAEAAGYYRKKCLTCHTEKSCSLPLAQQERTSPPGNCISCHMPRQTLQRISHSALTNHRIVAYAGEPFPQVAFQQTTPSLPDLAHIDAAPGPAKNTIPVLVLLQAYGELMGDHPEYKPRYEKMLDEAYAEQPGNPLVLAAIARRDASNGTQQGLASARRLLKQIIASGSASASDYELYGYLVALSGDRATAIDILTRGITLNPYSTGLYKRLALTYAHFHDYEDALGVMKQELRMFPEDSYMRDIVHRVETQRATR